jgi:hypothetical protein
MVTLPFWMVQRQVKAEPVGEEALLLKTPNLPTFQVGVRPRTDGPGWFAQLHSVSAAGDRVLIRESPEALMNRSTAWQFAFELFRQEVII